MATIGFFGNGNGGQKTETVLYLLLKVALVPFYGNQVIRLFFGNR